MPIKVIDGKGTLDKALSTMNTWLLQRPPKSTSPETINRNIDII